MIDIIDLQKIYDNGYEALKSVNFHINKGDLVCLLGPSGCGKSTMLNAISGLIAPTAGDILFDGKSVVSLAPKDRKIGFVFQNYALYPHMTVLENILFPLSVGDNKLSKEEALQRANKYMELTQIKDLQNKKPGILSGGQQQRVAITRALVQEPEVLLLDEPLSNLDARLRLKIREEIRKLVKEVGITTIFVTHDQEEALSISDKIVLLNDGIVQQDDDPKTLYLEPRNEFVAKFIGNPQMNLLKVTISNGQIKHPYFEFMMTVLDEQRIKGHLVDGEYTLGIRPENIYFSSEVEGLFKATISNIEMIGREWVINLRLLNDDCLKVVRPIASSVELDGEQYLAFDYDKLFLFNKDGERVY